MTTRDSAQSGMTLVETLISLFLLGLIASMTAVLLPAVKRGADRSTDFQRRSTELARTHEFLRKLIENSLPAALVNSAESEIPPLSRDAAHLEMITVLPPGLGGGGLYRATLTIEGAVDHRSLILRLTSLRPDAPAPTGGPLITEATSISWSYFDPIGRNWADNAAGISAGKGLVKLSVETPQTGRWPPLIAAPQLDGGTNCRLDAITNSCRESLR